MSLKTPEERERMSKIPYASAIGSIMYAMLCTRPDVAYSISVTSRYQSNPGEDHWKAVKNILKGDVNIERVDTLNNVADPLTKPLSQSHFDRHKDKMGIRYQSDWLYEVVSTDIKGLQRMRNKASTDVSKASTDNIHQRMSASTDKASTAKCING
ncbi:hypothetical protein AgCh_036005 [Apium graveolens]